MENNDSMKTEQVNKYKTMNFKQKIKHILTNITIEPILICYILPAALMGISTQNMYLTKACVVNLNYTEDICWPANATNGTEGDEAQKEVAYMTAWKSLVAGIVPATLILFMGSWSDKRRRRKPFLLLPLCGDLLLTISYIINAHYFYQLPIEVAGAGEAVIPSLFGSSTALIMAIFSYVADITSEKVRTFRIGIVNSLYSMCIMLGNSLSGILLQEIEYIGVFSLSTTFYFIGIIYCIFRVKEPNPPIPIPKSKSFFRDFFDLRLARDAFAVGFKKREGNQRMVILLLMVLSIFTAGPTLGEGGVTYYFIVKRLKWDDVTISLYFTYQGVIAFIGNTLGVFFLIKLLKLSDGMIGVVCCLCKLIASIIYAFASVGWLFYVGPVIEMFGSVSITAMRAIASKSVPPDELGKIYSLFGFCEALAPLVFGPIYSSVYGLTVQTLPGTFYLMSATFTGILALIFLTLYCIQRKQVDKSSDAKVKVDLSNGDHPKANINEAFQGDEGDYTNGKIEVTKL